MNARTQTLPPNHPLAGAVEKAWRAHEHFELLQREVNALGSAGIKLATFRTELKPNSENLLCTVVDRVTEPPLRLATILGDVVHNLRSSLDHLVFELAFLGLRGRRIPERTAFPGSLTRANWRSPYVQNVLLEGVLKKHRAMLYQAQPCYRQKDAPTSPRTIRRRKRSATADLQKLWNEDKHRMLQPVVVTPYTIKPSISQFRDCKPVSKPTLYTEVFGRPLKEGTPVLTIPIRRTGSDPQVHVGIEITGEISLRNGFPVLYALAT